MGWGWPWSYQKVSHLLLNAQLSLSEHLSLLFYLPLNFQNDSRWWISLFSSLFTDTKAKKGERNRTPHHLVVLMESARYTLQVNLTLKK